MVRGFYSLNSNEACHKGGGRVLRPPRVPAAAGPAGRRNPPEQGRGRGGSARRSTARVAPFPRQPPSGHRLGKMSAGGRRCAAGFAFRSLPQKAFPCLEDRDIRDRLLKWWEGEGRCERSVAGCGGELWEAGGRAVLSRGVVAQPRPQGAPLKLRWVCVSLFPRPVTGSLLRVFQARKTPVAEGARRSSLPARVSRDPFHLRSVGLVLLRRSCASLTPPRRGRRRF